MAIRLTFNGGTAVRVFADVSTKVCKAIGNKNNEWRSVRVDQVQAGDDICHWDQPGPTMTVDTAEVI